MANMHNYRLTCRFCGYDAQYDDISDGDFDAENGECFPCSEENRELRERRRRCTRDTVEMVVVGLVAKKVEYSNTIDTVLEKRYSKNTVPEWMDENVRSRMESTMGPKT